MHSFLALLPLVLFGVREARRTDLSIIIESDGHLNISENLNSNADVQAIYIEEMNATGWDILEVKINVITSSVRGYTVSDSQRAFAAGVAEGYLTAVGINALYGNLQNTSFWDFTHGPPDNLQQFLNQQSTYMSEQIAQNPTDPFWSYANLLRHQLSGVQFGYNASAPHYGLPTYAEPNAWPFVFLNLVGDLLDLTAALNASQRLNYDDYSNEEYLRMRLQRGRCSALIKVTPQLDNLIIGHSSWFVYQNTLRIFKHYKFTFETVPTAANHMMFSSYPGYLVSLDDFYVMDSGLAMLQTTNSVPNTTLYDLVKPESLFAWQRVRIANALSKTGEEWFGHLANQNSGTYNNQYMVIDYGRFVEGEPLKEGLLWVIEQIPGFVDGADMTNVLERGYFASYNVPALESVYNRSGYPAMVESKGVENSYDLAPRARIFRRDANAVSDLQSFGALLRYNNYKEDAIENNNAMWAICSRGDLLAKDAAPFGCYDTKMANLTMIRSMQAMVINGPTYDNLPPFNWADWPQYQHVHAGIPNLMKFDWQHMQPQL